jgi:hypothetical protein
MWLSFVFIFNEPVGFVYSELCDIDSTHTSRQLFSQKNMKIIKGIVVGYVSYLSYFSL